jgi:hypothetical protein
MEPACAHHFDSVSADADPRPEIDDFQAVIRLFVLASSYGPNRLG